MSKRIILASASPRRRELLAQIGIPYEVAVSHKEEIYYSSSPEEIVKELSLRKAENVASELDIRDGIIIGADTVVVLDGRILGKPADPEDACRMIRKLQGRSHQVYTGIALLDCGREGEPLAQTYAVCTTVYVHSMTEKEIQEYVASGESMDKAGGYGIQGRFAAYIDKIEGDYYNVVGLPLSLLYQCLKEKGICI